MVFMCLCYFADVQDLSSTSSKQSLNSSFADKMKNAVDIEDLLDISSGTTGTAHSIQLVDSV